MKIVVSGGSGFIGSELIPYLYQKGHQVISLTRKNKKSPYYWDPDNNVIDPSLFSGSDAVINLSGENLFGRWSKLKQTRITYSRLHSSHFLVNTLLKLHSPPKLYIGASAIGYYGDRGNEKLTEESPPGVGFLADLCKKWEEIPTRLTESGVRVVATRFGMVIGQRGGALPSMVIPFKFGFGGVVGDGSQIVSWIAIDDLLSGISQVIEREELRGPINFTSPQPISNRDLTTLLGQLLHRPTFFALPKFCLSLLVGKGTEIFLSSDYVLPEKLIHSGFHFQFPDIESTLKKYLRLND